jgi:hypothetical protein
MMAAMKRRLFQFLSALSLLLFMAAVSLWVRGQWVGDFIWHNGGRGATGVFIARGHVMLTRRTISTFNPITPGVGPPPWEISHERPPRDLLTTMNDLYGSGNYTRHAGFAWGVTREAGLVITRDATAPLWPLILATIILPMITLRRVISDYRRRRRHGAALCPQCGYDLRASLERCPECGLCRSRDGGPNHTEAT